MANGTHINIMHIPKAAGTSIRALVAQRGLAHLHLNAQHKPFVRRSHQFTMVIFRELISAVIISYYDYIARHPGSYAHPTFSNAATVCKRHGIRRERCLGHIAMSDAFGGDGDDDDGDDGDSDDGDGDGGEDGDDDARMEHAKEYVQMLTETSIYNHCT